MADEDEHPGVRTSSRWTSSGAACHFSQASAEVTYGQRKERLGHDTCSLRLQRDICDKSTLPESSRSIEAQRAFNSGWQTLNVAGGRRRESRLSRRAKAAPSARGPHGDRLGYATTVADDPGPPRPVRSFPRAIIWSRPNPLRPCRRKGRPIARLKDPRPSSGPGPPA